MTRTKIDRESIHCPKLGSVADVKKTYIFKDSRRIDPPLAEGIPLKFHCFNSLDCGVAVQKGSSISYNWDFCQLYLEFKDQRPL